LDGNGNVITRKDARNNTVEYEYDYANRLVKVTDPLGNSFSNSYDPVGNKIAETDPFGNETAYIYDEASQLIKVIDPRDNTSIINTYDRAGQLISVTDAEINSTSYTYDGCGRVKTVVDALKNETVYTYDDNGNLVNVLNANHNNNYLQYDALNRELAEINSEGYSTGKAYDPAGNLSAVTTADGQTITYQYDDMNRLSQKKYPDNTTVTYTYNELGQRTSMTDPAGTTIYAYDNLNRLQTVTRNGTAITYAYDVVGNITDIIYPNNQHLTYTYNELNLPETVSDGTKTQSVRYDIAARTDQETMPNGVTVDYEFDECGRLTLLKNKLNENIIAQFAYTYDKNGNRVSCTNKDGQVTAYAYDELNQLAEIQTGNKIYQYDYDAVGNRTNNEETMRKGDVRIGGYLYDYEDRLIKTESDNGSISYTYDGDSTLVKKTVTNGTESMIYEYFYDYTAGLPRLLVEKRSDGTNYNYLYFGGKLYGRTGAGGTVYYHHDGLGSVVAITDENGNILNEYTYEAFGEPIIIKETVENSIMFTGEPYDQSGFVYLRARYYDPTVGRFVSSDKYKGEIAEPSSQNGYSYCGNNPVNYVDPSGYKEVLLRSKIERAGGTIEWDPVKRTATATISGQKVVYRPDYDDRISINSKGHIVIDDSYLDNDFSSIVGHLWSKHLIYLALIYDHPKDVLLCY
jgi:RHS repeat-associated protein